VMWSGSRRREALARGHTNYAHDARRHSRKSSTARLSTGWNRSVTSNTASEWFGEQILWPRWRSSTSASAMFEWKISKRRE
jgi:hypothetical protein